MAEKVYIGARYVPAWYAGENSEWQANTAYQALTIVRYNGSLYVSKIPCMTTAGNPAEDVEHWAYIIEDPKNEITEINAEIGDIIATAVTGVTMVNENGVYTFSQTIDGKTSEIGSVEVPQNNPIVETKDTVIENNTAGYDYHTLTETTSEGTEQEISKFYLAQKQVTGVTLTDNQLNIATVNQSGVEETQAIEIPVTDTSDKMDKVNPTGTGSLSLNRASNTTVGQYSVAEGYNNTASGIASHAEGEYSHATGRDSHAEGTITTASGDYSHAEGNNTLASGTASHSEGIETIASAAHSHAEGDGATASGRNSHAEGGSTQATGDYSHAQGLGTRAATNCETALGSYNVSQTQSASARGTYALEIGNGTSPSARSNALAAAWTGDVRLAGVVYTGCESDSSGGIQLTPSVSASAAQANFTEAHTAGSMATVASLTLTLTDTVSSGLGAYLGYVGCSVSNTGNDNLAMLGCTSAYINAEAKTATLTNVILYFTANVTTSDNWQLECMLTIGV